MCMAVMAVGGLCFYYYNKGGAPKVQCHCSSVGVVAPRNGYHCADSKMDGHCAADLVCVLGTFGFPTDSDMGSICQPFDCNAELDNWKNGWASAKKSWCCKHQSKGCPDTTTQVTTTVATTIPALTTVATAAAAPVTTAAAPVITTAGAASGPCTMCTSPGSVGPGVVCIVGSASLAMGGTMNGPPCVTPDTGRGEMFCSDETGNYPVSQCGAVATTPVSLIAAATTPLAGSTGDALSAALSSPGRRLKVGGLRQS